MPRRRSYLWLLCWILLLGGCKAAKTPETSPEAPLSWGEMQEELTRRGFAGPVAEPLAYGPHPLQYGELRLPEGDGPFPLALVVHGGCWLSIAELDYMRPLADALNRAGWATWSLEFRRIDQDGGAWPGILEDVAAGADFARTLAERHPLDLDRVVSIGHSSGGHLALWLAGRDALPTDDLAGPHLQRVEPLPLAGAIGLAAIADLEDFTQYTRCGETIVPDLLGTDLASADARMAVTDPATMPPTAVPQLLVMGALDAIVPPAHAKAYRVKAEQEGRNVSVVTIEGAGHFELVAPWTAPWEEAWGHLARFLAQHTNR